MSGCASAMRRMASALTGLPVNAPFKSTMCRRRAPAATQRSATATGSSENTVTSSMRPCRRRTHLPSLRSMAGINSIRLPPSYASFKNWYATGRSYLPVPSHEIGEQAETRLLARFRVELHREHVVAPHGGGEVAGIVTGARDVRGIGRHRVITVDEIKAAVLRNTFPQRMRAGLMQFVPTHVRHLEPLAARRIVQSLAETTHLAADDAEPRRAVVLVVVFVLGLFSVVVAVVGLVARVLVFRFVVSLALQFAHAIAQRTDARKHHAVGARDELGVVGHAHPVAAPYVLEGLRDRAQIAHTIINDCN